MFFILIEVNLAILLIIKLRGYSRQRVSYSVYFLPHKLNFGVFKKKKNDWINCLQYDIIAAKSD